MKRLTCLVLILILAVPPKAALSWSEGGHHLIALMAFDLLSKEEQAKVVSILEKHPRFAEDFTPPERLPNDAELQRWRIGRVGYWPDVASRQPTYHRSTWHYELGLLLVIGEAANMKVNVTENEGISSKVPHQATVRKKRCEINNWSIQR